MFPRVTHPSAADVLLRPLDLHVLSLPPAFALSQDQTLKLDLNFEPADHNVLTRSHHFSSTEVDELPAIHIAGNDGVTLNVYRRSLSSGLDPKSRSSLNARPARTPPSTFLFLHLHLSNSPGPGGPNLPERKGSDTLTDDG